MNAKTIFSTIRFTFAATVLGLSVYAIAADGGRADTGVGLASCGAAANPCMLDALTVTASAGQRLADVGAADLPGVVETARVAPKAPPAPPAES
ncbi:MAG TPA: hypothetical protein VHG91_19690 [Longimicrobium sp.]|nr:hypothetical protein [Longimicrobium sp.]